MRFIVVLASNSIADAAASVAHALAKSSRAGRAASAGDDDARDARASPTRSVAMSPGAVMSRVMVLTRAISRESAVSASASSASSASISFTSRDNFIIVIIFDVADDDEDAVSRAVSAMSAHAHATVARRVVHDHRDVDADADAFVPILINRLEMSSSRPHRVVDDDALVGTRLVNALYKILPSTSPCAACDGTRDCDVAASERRKESSCSSDDDDDSHPGDTELLGPHASPRRKKRGKGASSAWTHAYASFRVTDDAHRREMDPSRGVSSQFDECNARLREDLDALDRARARESGEKGESETTGRSFGRQTSAAYATPSVVSAAEANAGTSKT